MVQNLQSNKKIAVNAIFLYLRMIVLMAINLYVGRLILEILGVDDYGIYNLVATIIVCFSFLRNALNDTALRYLTYEIGQGDDLARMRNLYSAVTICFMVLGIAAVVLIEFFWLIWGDRLNIPSGRFDAASVVMQFSLATFLLQMFQIPYTACIIAYERMSVFAKISIYEGVLKLGLVISLLYLPGDKLELYAAAMALNALLIFIFYRVYAVRHFEMCRFVRPHDKSAFFGLFAFSSWSLLGNVGSVVSESGIGLIFNWFCGVVLNAAIGVANQVNQAVMQFVYGFQTAFKPQIVKLFSSGDMPKYYRLVCNASKYSYFLIFLISIPLIVYNPEILAIWLKDVPPFASAFSQIILACSILDATSGAFFFAIGATGQIRNYQIYITLSFIANIFVTYLMLWLGLSYTLVFFSRFIFRGVVNFGIGLAVLKGLTAFPIGEYIKLVIWPIIRCSIIPAGLILGASVFFSHSLPAIIGVVAVFEIVALFAIFTFGLHHDERKRLLQTIKQKLHR